MQIMSMFYLVDNKELRNNSNKLGEITPICDTLNTVLVHYGIFHTFLSVDESLVSYYCRHNWKMFIRNKLIRFECDVWCFCGENGYPYQLNVYTGKSENDVAPLGTRVVKGMVDIVKEHSDQKRHELFFDNCFRSFAVLEDLADPSVKAIGTNRETARKQSTWYY